MLTPHSPFARIDQTVPLRGRNAQSADHRAEGAERSVPSARRRNQNVERSTRHSPEGPTVNARATTTSSSGSSARADEDATIGAPRWLAWLLIVTGTIGFVAAAALTYEGWHVLTVDQGPATCDFSPFVQCSATLDSWQGKLFGFPNAWIGLVGWTAAIAVGVATLAGARFRRWFWALFVTGVVLGFVLVLWLPQQSIFILGVVCPWCFVTWMTMYSLVWPLLAWNAKSGVFGARLQAFGAKATPWAWIASLATAIIVIVTAMVRIPEVVTYWF